MWTCDTAHRAPQDLVALVPGRYAVAKQGSNMTAYRCVKCAKTTGNARRDNDNHHRDLEVITIVLRE
jgi:hypothetical protein